MANKILPNLQIVKNTVDETDYMFLCSHLLQVK